MQVLGPTFALLGHDRAMEGKFPQGTWCVQRGLAGNVLSNFLVSLCGQRRGTSSPFGTPNLPTGVAPGTEVEHTALEALLPVEVVPAFSEA